MFPVMVPLALFSSLLSVYATAFEFTAFHGVPQYPSSPDHLSHIAYQKINLNPDHTIITHAETFYRQECH